jgi:DNA-binding NtrC family response regulator
MAQLLRHPWPGNVRELENTVSSACITAPGEMIDIEDLPESLRKTPGADPAASAWRPSTLDDVRREHIERVLEMCGGNRLRAAQVLGIGRTSLYRFLKRRPRRGAEKDGEDAAGAKPNAGPAGTQPGTSRTVSEKPPE